MFAVCCSLCDVRCLLSVVVCGGLLLVADCCLLLSVVARCALVVVWCS